MSYLSDGGHPDDPSPEYHIAISQGNPAQPASHFPSFHDPSAPAKPSSRPDFRPHSSQGYLSRSASRRLPTIPPERYVYTYSLVAGTAPLQFLISVEPENGRPVPGRCTFRLSLKVDRTERLLEEPVQLTLAVDPRALDFVVFVFPGKSSLPIGALYSYRVWLRVNGIEHRIFGEDELWIAKDPDFQSIADASFARIKTITSTTQIYDAIVGKAHVQFIVHWRQVSDKLYKYTLEYDANGVGGVLMEDFKLIIDSDPRKVAFLIYSVPMNTMPAGASHRVRVWLKTSLPMNSGASVYSLPFNESYVYQRIWKSDNFKVGAQLDFNSLGSKMIVGFSNGPPRTVTLSSSPTSPRLLYDKNIRDLG